MRNQTIYSFLFDHLEPALMYLFSDMKSTVVTDIADGKKSNNFAVILILNHYLLSHRIQSSFCQMKKENSSNKSSAHHYLINRTKEKKAEPIEDQASPSYSHVEYMRYLFEMDKLTLLRLTFSILSLMALVININHRRMYTS